MAKLGQPLIPIVGGASTPSEVEDELATDSLEDKKVSLIHYRMILSVSKTL